MINFHKALLRAFYYSYWILGRRDYMVIRVVQSAVAQSYSCHLTGDVTSSTCVCSQCCKHYGSNMSY